MEPELPIEERIVNAESEGRKAGDEGADFINPYKSGTPESKAWAKGYNTTQTAGNAQVGRSVVTNFIPSADERDRIRQLVGAPEREPMHDSLAAENAQLRERLAGAERDLEASREQVVRQAERIAVLETTNIGLQKKLAASAAKSSAAPQPEWANPHRLLKAAVEALAGRVTELEKRTSAGVSAQERVQVWLLNKLVTQVFPPFPPVEVKDHLKQLLDLMAGMK